MLSPKEMATLLFKTGCVQLNVKSPFTYASGLKGPIYCDNRLLLGQVEARQQVVSSLVELVRNKKIEFEVVAGLATAGIPYAAWMATELAAPMLYIRSKKKGHGKGKQVEGPFNLGTRALIVEDLVNQASSMEEATLGARSEGLIISDAICLVDYQMKRARERLSQHEIKLHALTNLTAIMQAALEIGALAESECDLLQAWQRDPMHWLN